jgi:hypothetical protein
VSHKHNCLVMFRGLKCGGLLFDRHKTPLTWRFVVYYCSAVYKDHAHNGMVTLKRPCRFSRGKKTVGAKATEIAGGQVKSTISVKPKF